MDAPDFGPLEICLYCLQNYNPNRRPTNEHIVPSFVGGKVVIKNGACEACARLSNSLYETPVAATTFLAFRRWSGLAKPKARGVPPMARGNAIRGPEAAFCIPATPITRPAIFSQIILPPPLFWDGRQNSVQNYRHESLRCGLINFTEVDQRFQASMWFEMNRKKRPIGIVNTYSETLDVTVRDLHDMRGIHLMHAKIAYCYAVAEVGLNRFRHNGIRDLLKGKRIDMATFVGGYTGDVNSLPKDSPHLVHLGERLGHLYAVVHLFAPHQGQPYEVVLGPIQ